MTNILITGGNGQLATCVKDFENQYNNLNFIYTDYLDLDITDLSQIKSFFKINKIDYCVNCAAYTAVDKAETEVDKAFQINSIGAKNLALACLEHHVVLIHISTDFVFSGEKTIPYLETDEAKPISVYGASKLQGEQEVQKILKEYFIIRTSWLYSEYGNNFMKTMLRLAEKNIELSVVSDQIGTPTYAGDLAKVIVDIIHDKKRNYGIYHYSNHGIASWFDFAKAIFAEAAIKINLNSINTSQYPTLAERPKYSVLEKSKIKEILEIQIPNWRDSLKKCLNKITIK